jgi:hypothetical protein
MGVKEKVFTPNDGDFEVIWRGLLAARITKHIEVPIGGQRFMSSPSPNPHVLF